MLFPDYYDLMFRYGVKTRLEEISQSPSEANENKFFVVGSFKYTSIKEHEF